MKYIPPFNYHILTAIYDFVLSLIGFGTKQRNIIVRLMKIRKNDTILDVGCGTGSLLLAIKQNNPKQRVIGIDPDSRALKIAHKKLKRHNLQVKLLLSGAEKLPFKKAMFSIVVSTLVFHHLSLSAKKAALKEIRRVLKANGRFYLIDFGQINGPLRLIYYLEVLFRIPEAKTVKDNIDGMIPYILKQAKFKHEEISPPYLGIRYIKASKLP